MAANGTGISIMIGGCHYWFNPAKYFVADQPLVTDAPIAPDDERLQHLVWAWTDKQSAQSGAESAV